MYSTTVTVVAGDTAAAQASASFTNDKTVTGSLEVTKHVQLNGTDTVVTESKTFTVGLYKWNATTSAWEAVQHDGGNWTQTITVAAGHATGTVTFSPLTVGEKYRVYELNESNTIAHNGLYQEYKVTYSDDSGVDVTVTAASASTTVTNNKETTTITAAKTWGDGTATPPSGTQITWTITAEDSDHTNVTATVIPTEADRSHTVSVAPWTTDWRNLPKVVNGKAVTYTVAETAYTIGADYTAETFPQADVTTEGTTTVYTFTNTLPTRDIIVAKAWSPDVWPEDIASVTVGLYAMSGTDTTPSEYPDAATQSTVTITAANSTAENVAQRTFSNLPVYDTAGNRITYSVQEISVTPTSGTAQTVTNGAVTVNGKTWTVLNEAVNDTTGTATVTNTYTGMSISVTKEWTQSGAQKATAASIGFTLHQVLKDNNGTIVQDSVYTGVAGHPTGAFTVAYTSGSGWQTVTISGLPVKGTATVDNGDGGTTTIENCDASYYVVETSAAADAGYVLATTYSSTENATANANASSKAVSTNNATITIINTETPGVELPSTGGPGTALYTVTGAALMLLALALLRRKRREEA